MNGFQATREIRAIEHRRRRLHRREARLSGQQQPQRTELGAVKTSETSESTPTPTPTPPPLPALVIALTGLASSQDQREAIASGVDLYMTKPVSFKDVGQILDNWELNGGRNAPEVIATPSAWEASEPG